MELDVDRHSLGIHEFECMNPEAILKPEPVWNPKVTEEDQAVEAGLGSEGVKVPEGIIIIEMCDGVPFPWPNETREEDWVTNWEDREVVSHEIPVTVLCVEFESKASSVPNRVWTSTLAHSIRKSSKDRSLLSDSVKDSGSGVLGNVVSDFKVAKSPAALGVHHSFRDPLSVEVGEMV